MSIVYNQPWFYIKIKDDKEGWSCRCVQYKDRKAFNDSFYLKFNTWKEISREEYFYITRKNTDNYRFHLEKSKRPEVINFFS